MKEKTDCRIIVADNGRVWVDGEVSGIISARNQFRDLSNNYQLLEDGGNL